MQVLLIPTMQFFYYTEVLCMQYPRLVSSPYVCMQVVLIPNEYVFSSTEFLFMQNMTHYSKMEYFVRKRLCICCRAQPPPGLWVWVWVWVCILKIFQIGISCLGSSHKHQNNGAFLKTLRHKNICCFNINKCLFNLKFNPIL